jgi:hypothetical protein
VLLIILAFCVVCFAFLTQKTKMIGNTDPHKEKKNTQHRKLK